MINLLAQQMFGIQGPVINLYGWGGLIFHASLNTISFMFLMLVGFFKQMDASYEEAAITLGANKLKVMRTITFPMLMPAVLSISLLVFIHGLELFEIRCCSAIPAASMSSLTKSTACCLTGIRRNMALPLRCR